MSEIGIETWREITREMLEDVYPPDIFPRNSKGDEKGPRVVRLIAKCLDDVEDILDEADKP